MSKTTTTETKMLQVGDVLYQSHYERLTKITIDRVTPKRAFSGTIEFDRELNHQGWIYQRGASRGWGASSYYLSNESLEAKYKLQVSKDKVYNLLVDLQERYPKMSQDQLEKVIEALSSVRSL